MISLKPPFDLLTLHNARIIAQMGNMIETLDFLHANVDDIVAAYQELCLMAPRRHAKKKSYFVGHTGYPSGKGGSNRREEHLAIALWNTAQEAPLLLPDGSKLHFLDYQFPLKASQQDKGIGKADLFGVTDAGQPCVVELKIHREDGRIGESPLRAYLEALAYAAIVQANLSNIAQEASGHFEPMIIQEAPAIMVLAPEEYWRGFFSPKDSESGWSSVRAFAEAIHQQIGVKTHFASMSPSDFSMGSEERKPRLHEHPALIDAGELIQ